jgi:hypothetical protein
MSSWAGFEKVADPDTSVEADEDKRRRTGTLADY